MTIFRTALTTAGIAAVAVTTTLSTAGATTPGHQATTLHQDAIAVHDAGAVGVLAETQTRGRTSYVRAGATRAHGGRPVPLDAEFRIGSTTKTFISATLLQLTGEHRLSLNDTVEHWLPGVVSGNDNDGRHITVRQILRHQSGIYNFLEDEQMSASLGTAANFQRNRFRAYTPQQLVAIAMTHRPNFKPGKGWSYSNTNYVIAGMIIKKVTGHSWASEVQRRIIAPLHLHHTYIPLRYPYLIGPHAHGYESFPDVSGLTDVTALNVSAADASGSIVSSTADVHTFFRALIGGRLLRPAQQRDLQSTVKVPDDFGTPPGTRYGLGIFRIPLTCGGSYWGHPGDIPGFQSVNGVTANGHKSVVASSTGPAAGAVEMADLTLVDHALCRS